MDKERMAYDDDYDEPNDEDWCDEDEPDDNETASCPDCGKPMHRVAACCPACGYWLTETDRRAMWDREDKPRWVRIAVALVLLMTIAGLVAMAF